MASYHFHLAHVSRGAGQSAVTNQGDGSAVDLYFQRFELF